ncbi:MAG: hypothetical protein H7099_07180 [Gemmatimonadaceae bacterium]|nr:hypothetical protein [Gemmatimonadaceae bacterium]
MKVRARGVVLAAMLIAGCQDNAPSQLGSSVIYVAGFIRTVRGPRQVAIRLDRQACFDGGRLNFRDASGLGVLVIEAPRRGWTVRTYAVPDNQGGARGYLNISGVVSSYPLVRGTTRISRTDSLAMEGEIAWTLGEPLAEGISDTTQSYLRAVGRFSAVPGCVL